VHAQAGRYRGVGLFRSWLFRIAGNLVRSALRRRRVLSWVRFDVARHDRAAGGESAQESLERRERSRQLRAALARLPERQRAAVVLRQDEGLSYREIAAALDTTESAVESLLTRAIAALRRDLAREE
jgi:RNA polymerase sigma-70 factor, ECF subfamily